MTPTLLCMTCTPMRRVFGKEFVEHLVVGARVVEVRQVTCVGNDREARIGQRSRQLGARADARFRVVLAVDDQDRQIELLQIADARELRRVIRSCRSCPG